MIYRNLSSKKLKSLFCLGDLVTRMRDGEIDDVSIKFGKMYESHTVGKEVDLAKLRKEKYTFCIKVIWQLASNPLS